MVAGPAPPITPSTVTFDSRGWYYPHLYGIIEKMSEAAINKQVERWYRCLEDFSGKVVPFVNDPAKADALMHELEELFKMVYKDDFVNADPARMGPGAKQAFIKQFTELLVRLREYNNAIFWCLGDMDMLLPRKRDLRHVIIGRKK
jgi:hypothetical protein